MSMEAFDEDQSLPDMSWHGLECNEQYKQLEPDSLLGKTILELETDFADKGVAVNLTARRVAERQEVEELDIAVLTDAYLSAEYRIRASRQLYGSVLLGLECEDLLYDRAVNWATERTLRRTEGDSYAVPRENEKLMVLVGKLGLLYQIEEGLHFQELINNRSQG